MSGESIWYLAGMGCLFLSCAATALHILLNMRDESERATLWLLLVFAFPLFGVLLYLSCGLNRRDTFGHRVDLALGRIGKSAKQELSSLFAARNDDLSLWIAREKENGELSTSFRVTLDRIFPESIPLTGNEVKLLCDGDGAYPLMLRAIRNAKHTIHMQSFIISNDRIGSAIFDALAERAAAGVNVKVIYDSFGSFGAICGHFFYRYAHRSENFKIRAYSRASLLAPWRNQLRNHRKLLIVDGKTAFLGGLNISAENFRFSRKHGPAIHDLHCRIRGPAVSELQYVFLEDWCIAAKTHPRNVFLPDAFPKPVQCGDNSVRVIPSGHGFSFQGSEQCFYTAVTTAKKYVWIATPYFVPDKPFIKALRMAAVRGVEVRILLPRNNNHWFMRLASRNLYDPLCSDGVRVFERKGVFSHAKAMLVDGEWALFGSSNCDVRSFRLNYELDIIVSNGSFLTSLHTQFLHEFSNAAEIGLEDLERLPIPRRLAQSFCALFTPLL